MTSKPSDSRPSSEAGSGGALEELRDHTLRGREPVDTEGLRGHEDLRHGDQLTVTIGASTFSPISFNSFTVGPFSARVTVLEDETATDAYIRGRRELLAIERAEYEAALEQYFDRLKNNDKARQRRK
jgi:hypothetical protein